ncbi:MAG: hypothetical protein AAB518_03425, partial [Patescibacteria group bacterium]
SENIRYSENLGPGTKEAYDYTNWGENVEFMYEAISCGDGCRNLKFSFDCWPAVRDSEYCLGCHSSADLFGCVGLRNKQYCILNRQYSKDEYEKLRKKIIEHMSAMPYADKQGRIYKYGEFFPPEFSPLAYNETKAIDYYPKTKNEAEREGYLWRESDPKEYESTLKADALPDHIKDVPDTITKELIQCLVCKKTYRILDRELEFYRRFGLPLPRACHLCRYTERVSIRNPRTLFKRVCQCLSQDMNGYKNTAEHHHGGAKCTNEFQTSYSPKRPEIIYCESCYQAEVS